MIVRGLTIDPPLFLAPMAGITHTAFRRLLMELGGVGCLFTEMLMAKYVLTENPESPYLKRTPSESPIFYQMVTSDPEFAASAARIFDSLGASGVDVNCGCPAPDIRWQGGGSKLMEEPDKARAVVRAVRKATELPVSAKIRLGLTLDEAKFLDFAKMLEDEGVDIIFVHGRLIKEPYGRRPRWDWIGKAVAHVKTPVVANGSVFSAEDAQKCLESSGAAGLMLGRGAVMRPWLFSHIAHALYGGQKPEAPNLPMIYRRFVELTGQSFVPERRLGRTKEFTHHFAENFHFGHTLKSEVQNSRSVEEALARAGEFFKRSVEGFEGYE